MFVLRDVLGRLASIERAAYWDCNRNVDDDAGFSTFASTTVWNGDIVPAGLRESAFLFFVRNPYGPSNGIPNSIHPVDLRADGDPAKNECLEIRGGIVDLSCRVANLFYASFVWFIRALSGQAIRS